MQKPALQEFGISEKIILDVGIYNKRQDVLSWRATHSLIVAVGLICSSYFGLAGLLVVLIPYISIFGIFLLQLLIKSNFYPDHTFTINISRYLKKVGEYEVYVNKLSRDYWFSLDGHQFEKEMKKILTPFFKEVILTKGSGDGGVDIVIDNYDKERIIVQCKAHKKPIGPEPMRALIGVMGQFNASKGVFISLGGFSKGAKETATYSNIYIMTIDDVIKMHNDSAANIIEFAGKQIHYSS